jgi:hypothetical protein
MKIKSSVTRDKKLIAINSLSINRSVNAIIPAAPVIIIIEVKRTILIRTTMKVTVDTVALKQVTHAAKYRIHTRRFA